METKKADNQVDHLALRMLGEDVARPDAKPVDPEKVKGTANRLATATLQRAGLLPTGDEFVSSTDKAPQPKPAEPAKTLSEKFLWAVGSAAGHALVLLSMPPVWGGAAVAAMAGMIPPAVGLVVFGLGATGALSLLVSTLSDPVVLTEEDHASAGVIEVGSRSNALPDHSVRGSHRTQ